MPIKVFEYSLEFTCPFCGVKLPMSHAKYIESLGYLDKGLMKICDECGEGISKSVFVDNITKFNKGCN